MGLLTKYLKFLNEEELNNESIFPIDSPQKTKKSFTDIYESINFDEKNIILIDFDRTIHKYSESWKDGSVYDDPIPNAKETIKKLKDDGYQIVIFTARLNKTTYNKEERNKQKIQISNWLKKHDIIFDAITGDKIPGKIYIDDMGYHFKGVWNDETYSEIKARLNSAL